MNSMNSTMQEAMRLMQTGNLHAATEAIQRGLRASAQASRYGAAPEGRHEGSDVIDGEYRVEEDTVAPMQARGQPNAPERERDTAIPGEFQRHRHVCVAGEMHYKLFIPSGITTAAAPLIVMLHGCSQSPDDFARGTRMNLLAQQNGYLVAYPAQSSNRNAGKCWNWFSGPDQQRDRGEPAVLASLTRELVKRHGLDERRVYVAGLSAGGAMAAVLASTHPDVYAAFGVHSGLPVGVAHDLPSALVAMRQGGSVRDLGANPVPAIVFHGDRDTTVDRCNGEAIIAQCIGMAGQQPGGATRSTVEQGQVPGGRRFTRTIYANVDGSVAAEQWLVHGAAHAWSGGHSSGSYTDPSGPDASAQMLRFFTGCVRRAIN